MEWLNEPPSWTLEGHDLRSGTLEIVTGFETDFWRATHYGFTKDDGHAYLRRGVGDFRASVRFEGEYAELYDQAGMMLRLDDRNWIKAGVELEAGKHCLSAVVTREFSDWNVLPLERAPEAVWMRLERSGDAVRVDYSLDGTRFEMLRLAYFPPNVPAQVGLMACSPKREGFKARFTDLRFSGFGAALEGSSIK